MTGRPPLPSSSTPRQSFVLKLICPFASNCQIIILTLNYNPTTHAQHIDSNISQFLPGPCSLGKKGWGIWAIIVGIMKGFIDAKYCVCSICSCLCSSAADSSDFFFASIIPSNIFSAFALALSSKVWSRLSLLSILILDSSTLTGWTSSKLPSLMQQKLKVSITFTTLFLLFFLPILPSAWNTFRMALQVEIFTPIELETSLMFSPLVIIRSMMACLTSPEIFLQLCLLFFYSLLIFVQNILFRNRATEFTPPSSKLSYFVTPTTHHLPILCKIGPYRFCIIITHF